ncbi:MAG: hypothetical protein ACXWRZ_04360 [Bdellovibrio sp.]
MKIFEGVTIPVSWFVLPLFLVRVLNGQISGDSGEIRSAVKGLILYFVLIMSFGLILDLLLQIPQSFIPEISTKEFVTKTQALSKKEVGNFELLLKTSPEILTFILECILAFVYWAILILHILVMVLMTAMAPIIFLLSCILNVGIPVRIFFGIIIISSSWPVIWYGFDQALGFIEHIVPNTFGQLVLELIVAVLKGIGPAGVAYMSLSSGPGKTVVSAATKGFSLASSGASKAGKLGSRTQRFVSREYNKAFKARTTSIEGNRKNQGSRTLEQSIDPNSSNINQKTDVKPKSRRRRSSRSATVNHGSSGFQSSSYNANSPILSNNQNIDLPSVVSEETKSNIGGIQSAVSKSTRTNDSSLVDIDKTSQSLNRNRSAQIEPDSSQNYANPNGTGLKQSLSRSSVSGLNELSETSIKKTYLEKNFSFLNGPRT